MSDSSGRRVVEQKESGQKSGISQSSIGLSRIQRPFSNGKLLSASFTPKEVTPGEGELKSQSVASMRSAKEGVVPNRVLRSKTTTVLQNHPGVYGGSNHGDLPRARSFTASMRAACIPKTSVLSVSGVPLSRTTSVVMSGRQARCDRLNSSESKLTLQETSLGVRLGAQKSEAAGLRGARRSARPPLTRRVVQSRKESVSEDTSVTYPAGKGYRSLVSRGMGKASAPRGGREKSVVPSVLSRERLEARGASDTRNVSRKRGVSEQRVFRVTHTEKDILRQDVVERIQSLIAEERFLRSEAKAFQCARETHNKMENALARKIVVTKTVEAELERVRLNLRETLRQEQESAAAEKEKVARLSREVLMIDAELEEEQRALRETQCLIEVARSKQKNAAALLGPLGEKAKKATLNLSILEKRLEEELKAEGDLEASMHVLAKDIFWICRLWNAKGGKNEKVAIGVSPAPPSINELTENDERTKKEFDAQEKKNTAECDFQALDDSVPPSLCYAISLMREDDSNTSDVAPQQCLTADPVRLPVTGVPTAWISVRPISPESKDAGNRVAESFSACSFSIPFDRVIEHDPMHRPHRLLALDWEKFVASAPNTDTQHLLQSFVARDQTEKENVPLFDAFGQEQVVGCIETLMREAFFPSVAALPKPSAVGFISLGVGSASVDSGSVWGSQETTKESDLQVEDGEGDTKCVGMVEAGLRALFKECDRLNGKGKEKSEPRKGQSCKPIPGPVRERYNRLYYVTAAIVTEDGVNDLKNKLKGESDSADAGNVGVGVPVSKNHLGEKKAVKSTTIGSLEELLCGNVVAGLGDGMHLQRPDFNNGDKENGCLGTMAPNSFDRPVLSDPKLPNWMTFDISEQDFDEAFFPQMRETKQPHGTHPASLSLKEDRFGLERGALDAFFKPVMKAPALESQGDQESGEVFPFQFAVYDSAENLLGELRKRPHIVDPQKSHGFGVVVDVLLRPSMDAGIEPQRALTVLFLNLCVPPQEATSSPSLADREKRDMWRLSGSSVIQVFQPCPDTQEGLGDAILSVPCRVCWREDKGALIRWAVLLWYQDITTLEVLNEIMRFPRVAIRKKKSPATVTARSLRDGTGTYVEGRSIPTTPRVAANAVQRQQSTFQRTCSMTPRSNTSMEDATQEAPALPAKSHLGQLMQLFNSRVKQDALAGSANGGAPGRGGCLTVITDVHSPTTQEAHEADLLAALWRIIEARSAEVSSSFAPGLRY